MTRPATRGLFVLLTLALAACSDEDDPPAPCGTCPDERFEAAVSCAVCDPAAPITLHLENNWGAAYLTTICDWRLLGASPEGWQEIQRPDCSATLPLPILVESGAPPVVYPVTLEPDSLPPLADYTNFLIEVRLVGTGEEQGRELSVRTPGFDLVPAAGRSP